MTSEKPETEWGRLRAARAFFLTLSAILAAMTMLVAVGSLVAHVFVVPAVILALLTAHAVTCAAMLKRLATMQARIDMMLIFRGKNPE